MLNRCQIDPWGGEGEADSRVGSAGPVPNKALTSLRGTVVALVTGTSIIFEHPCLLIHFPDWSVGAHAHRHCDAQKQTLSDLLTLLNLFCKLLCDYETGAWDRADDFSLWLATHQWSKISSFMISSVCCVDGTCVFTKKKNTTTARDT